jgi:hypothetical protein
MISSRIADGMGFPALYATGFGTVASHLGIATGTRGFTLAAYLLAGPYSAGRPRA